MHLQIHASRKEAADTSRKQNFIFHALWVLYLLSAIVIALDIVGFVILEFVSDNERLLFLTWQIGDITMTYDLAIAQIIVFGFCDFIAQSILVRKLSI